MARSSLGSLTSGTLVPSDTFGQERAAIGRSNVTPREVLQARRHFRWPFYGWLIDGSPSTNDVWYPLVIFNITMENHHF